MMSAARKKNDMSRLLTPLSDIDAAMSKRILKAAKRKDSRHLIFSNLAIIVLICLGIAVFLHFFSLRFVRGNDMFPEFSDGDLVMCCHYKEYKKNDAVFYMADGERHFGRVVAKSGDEVDISETGILFVNGTAQGGEIWYDTEQPDDWNGSIKVPDNSVFILGDYRREAIDSREFGCIPTDDVDDKVIALFRHRKF